MIVKNWKYRIAYSSINRKVKDRNRRSAFFNFQTAKTIGIIWSADGDCSSELVNQFRKKLESRDLSVSMLAYCTHEETTDMMQNGYNFFTPKEVGIWGLPKSDTVESFLNENHDILLDLSLTEQLPIQYIVALSKATMKVGWSNSKQNYYDLTIDVSKQPEIGFLMTQIKAYLDNINIGN